ncbi:hypothetical protein DFS34DRAFT_596520 [Phlyctochytrium arcticum]|nr:hypothetical protein DFS34DRAFT_596520 [Phlyctochytrium arcticum]
MGRRINKIIRRWHQRWFKDSERKAAPGHSTSANEAAMEVVASSSTAMSEAEANLEFLEKMTGSLVPGVGIQGTLHSSSGPSGTISNIPGSTSTTFLAGSERSTPQPVPSADITLGKGQLVGRHVEKDIITRELRQFKAYNRHIVSSVLVFEAEGGQGLSTLLDYARVEAANNFEVAMCTASATETEKSTPLYALPGGVFYVIYST